MGPLNPGMAISESDIYLVAAIRIEKPLSRRETREPEAELPSKSGSDSRTNSTSSTTE